jgi:hypothetical protein
MDRDVLDVIEREIDDEARTRFPGGAVRRVALLQYGDDPQIDPRDLWVPVLLNSAGPEDYERSWQAFAGAHQAAIEEFPRYLAEKVREIINVEFRFSENTDIRGGNDGPQYGFPAGRRLSGYQEWERGEATFVHAPMGPAGLETRSWQISRPLARRPSAGPWTGSASCRRMSSSVRTCSRPAGSPPGSRPRMGEAAGISTVCGRPGEYRCSRRGG